MYVYIYLCICIVMFVCLSALQPHNV
jgi:hypothetical protein